MAREKRPNIVAELGRPETASETAARKAEGSRLYRERKTVSNLVLSLIVCVGLVIVMVLIVPRGTDTWSDYEVDVAAIAATEQDELIIPAVSADWKAKQAQLRTENGSDIRHWYIGYNTSDGAYVAVIQAFDTTGAEVPPEWIAEKLENQNATGTTSLGGFEWTVYDHSDGNPDNTNVLYGLQTSAGNQTLLVYGTAEARVIEAVAASVAAEAISLDLASLSPADTDQPSSSTENE